MEDWRERLEADACELCDILMELGELGGVGPRYAARHLFGAAAAMAGAALLGTEAEGVGSTIDDNELQAIVRDFELTLLRTLALDYRSALSDATLQRIGALEATVPKR